MTPLRDDAAPYAAAIRQHPAATGGATGGTVGRSSAMSAARRDHVCPAAWSATDCAHLAALRCGKWAWTACEAERAERSVLPPNPWPSLVGIAGLSPGTVMRPLCGVFCLTPSSDGFSAGAGFMGSALRTSKLPEDEGR